jgi:UDP-N-acetylmuramate--alanine ligase
MDLNKVNKVYFLGIGGIGMSALARYFRLQGADIYGYDLTPSPLTKTLEQEGMYIHYETNVSAIPHDIEFAVYTPAIPKDNAEFVYLLESGIPLMKRSVLIGQITEGKFTIAIAGTHGKTSISAMTAHMLNITGKNTTAFIGGIMKNYNSNLVYSKDADFYVVEADEYDRSFLQLKPNIALISSIDADHLDIYGDKKEMTEGFKLFAAQINSTGTLIVNEKVHDVNQKLLTYGFNEPSAIRATNINITGGKFVFDIESGTIVIKSIKMMIPGHHYIENALAAAAIGISMKMPGDKIKEALESFKGVDRRFELRIKTDRIVYIDDYAHHPQEIIATLRAIRLLFPNRKLTGIFQPHLYSRTRDLACEFASSLENLDEIVLLPVYPAREKPIAGVSSGILFDKIQNINKFYIARDEIIPFLKDKPIEVLVTMGAGDIGLLAPKIEKMLSGK